MEENSEASMLRFDDSGDETLTSQEALREMEAAWLNEKFAPEILPHQSDLVDCMLQQISHMEENIKKLDKSDLRVIIHRMELDRIRYLVCNYLRIRLEKIERYVIHILSQEARRSSEDGYLNSRELRMAKEYLSHLETLFRGVALQHMPANFQEFTVKDLTVMPNMHSHVFLRAAKNISGIILTEAMDEEINFEEGSQHIIRYGAVADLVKNRDVQLI
ncbi:DNA replication complex GINS protein SLD5 [Orussus abietinus]|uniref:DNA replication complex GINS protein SLD5 n=1 Tax=Orussus abietinus TaxID=222816 RepID=UPI000626E39D|nr:DNA replication complex GINS protein SLD5 [Orussus abietinus]XP_012278803.1 DNA replication complex GINS protein SLD5 [Orussus abietinus]